MSTFAPAPSIYGWLVFSDNQACGWCLHHGDAGRGLGKMRFQEHFSYCSCHLLSAQSGDHSFSAQLSFHRSTAVTHIVVSESTPVDVRPCPPRALVPGSMGLVERLCHTRSINPTVCQLAHPPHSQREGKFYVLKKATTLCRKMSLILPPIGPWLGNI